MNRPGPIALACVLLFAAVSPTTQAAADDAALLRCRAIVDAGPRLACYDALPVAGSAATSSRPAAAAAASSAAPSAPAQRDFGLPPAATPAGEVNAVESVISGRFEGWLPEQQITLANGQVWRVADGSRATLNLNSPKVRVERGAFGSFHMVIEGTNHTPRVRRVR